MKDGRTKYEFAQHLGILYFEMEVAGLMDNFPYLVIKRVSDYSDAQKYKRFQKYAALTAATYTKELLSNIPAKSTTSLSRPRNVDLKSILEHHKIIMKV
jgi:hypothetical protein